MNRQTTFAASLVVALAAAHASAQPAASTQPYKMGDPIRVGGQGGWDYVTVDADHHLLYITRSTHTQVIDAAARKVVADIAGQSRNHGVALVPAAGRGFITDGGAGKLVAFDLKTNQSIGTIDAADDADGAVYDAGTDRVLVACGDAGQMVLLDPKADVATAKVDKVDLGGKPESLTADGHGMAFVDLEDKNSVAAVDVNAKTVKARWPVAPGGSPAGLAFDAARGVLFVGCREPARMVVMNSTDGKVIADLPIGAGCDACAFDPGTGTAFASCRDGTTTAVRETSPGKYEVVQTIQTPVGSRTMGVDTATHALYWPAAEMAPAAPGQRPRPKAGSFYIAVAKPAE